MSPTASHSTLQMTVRGDELDRTGGIGPAQLLRYLENGRWQAAATANSAMTSLFTAGRKMVIREQRLVVHDAATWGEELTVQTWLARAGRTSVEFGHLLTRTRDGSRVCEAALTGVQIDDAGRPTPLPDGVTATPEPPMLSATLQNLTLPEAPSPVSWSWTQTIRPSQTDLFRHVNHSRYVDLFEDARWFMERAQGLPGWQPKRRLVAVGLEYRREAKAGEDVRVLLHNRDDDTLDALLLRGDQILTRCVLRVDGNTC